MRRLFNSLLYLLFLGVSTLFLLELCYRCYVVDFYGGNLRALNETELITAADQPNILVIGDSFTADTQSYIRRLRDSISTHHIINAAVPGTCIRQHEQFAPKRFRQFSPDLVIYQLYVGNDLLEYRHPSQSPNISWQRRWYWWLADRFLILGYINAKLPQLRQTLIGKPVLVEGDFKVTDQFHPEYYSRRTKMLLRAEPELLENSALLLEERKKDMQAMVLDIRGMLAELAPDIPVFILIMPHCVQMGAPYVDRMQELGAVINSPNAITAQDFPFYDYLNQELSDEHTAIINSLPWLQEQADSTLFYPNDPHLNSRGQALVGDSLLQYIWPLITPE